MKPGFLLPPRPPRPPLALLLLAVALVPGLAVAADALTEAAVLRVNAAINAAFEDGDFEALSHYYAPDARLIVDLDPAPGRGQSPLDLDGLMKMTETGMALMENARIHDEVLALRIEPNGTRAVLETRSIATMTMMGMRLQDVSLSTTTFGLVNGELRIVAQEDEIVSSGPAP